jgi:2-amino-4-hydroxy-6-hydroxymethyldihydropteridine diphosphokinase
MKTVYLGLGSNVGDRERMLQDALDLLHRRDLTITRVSSVYETEPMEIREQRWFLNLVAEARTELFPQQLLARVGKIEHELGRRRQLPKGPRTIDIDILLYGSSVMRTPKLTIPHVRLPERRFVLEPLAELAPDLRDPVSRRSIRELLGAVAGQAARKIDFRPVIPENL